MPTPPSCAFPARRRSESTERTSTRREPARRPRSAAVSTGSRTASRRSRAASSSRKRWARPSPHRRSTIWNPAGRDHMSLHPHETTGALALGSRAPAFDLPGVDDRRHSLDDYADAAALALIQSCNHCPYVIAWEPRMNAIQRDYAERGVRLVAVSSNDADRYPADSFEEMKERGAEREF